MKRTFEMVNLQLLCIMTCVAYFIKVIHQFTTVDLIGSFNLWKTAVSISMFNEK